MILIQLLGASILFVLISSCSNLSGVTLSDLQPVDAEDFCPNFRQYLQIDSSINFESNAVICSFVGDQRKSLQFASKDAINSSDYQIAFEMDDSSKKIIISKQREILDDPNSSKEEKSIALKTVEALGRTKDLNSQFKNKTHSTALNFIVEKSKGFHFLLINEAHYSSQNRLFTKSLLEPLWNNGYRYLALEALSASDSLLIKRGYPINSSGYYLRESTFGNMVREASRLGFKLVGYESLSHDDNIRDSIQALNIFQKTYRTDSIGKVLVHAGYSHISESGDSKYRPMGFQLKKLLGKEVFSVDQQTMMWHSDSTKLHPYYRFVSHNFIIEEPLVIINEEGTPFLDPVNLFAVDLQVYHPRTIFVNGRPNWLISNKNQYHLPKLLLENYKGYLLQVIKKGESLDAVPIDQFVINEETNLLLTSGEYVFLIINQLGSLKAQISASIK